MSAEGCSVSSLPGAGLCWYLGLVTAAWWAARAAWCLLSGLRVWVLGSGAQVGPRLGKWAGEKFKVETKTIEADFGKPEEIYKRIQAGLEGLEIGVLVNNVGMSYNYPEYFLDIADLETTLDKLININITSVCKMTRLILPGMLERSKGVILNISSASGMYPVPLLTVYSATKAFVDFFSRGLHAEYKSKGITMQSVLPFFVATKMSKIRKPTWDTPSPEAYVRSALNTVGLQSQTNGYLPHAIMGWVTTSFLPIATSINLAMKMNKGLRARYLKRSKQN
ncbi:very-long-chain 3-oxoacyl-CoA reductase isoform X3 [Ascaphus truei]|uniref:very-long-chain 3-oxoacyl-CoA reductase isoform X3 n=1 Tax=Ascaphus truei TaxID=8439 RepID=UPI003F5AC3A2